MGTISTLNTYLKRVDGITSGSGNFIFRGQADSTWDVECSASIRLKYFLKKEGQLLKDVESPTYDFIQNYHNDELLEKIKIKRFTEYKELSSIEIIADLQHRGAATLLIDFTSNALVALYFACLSLGAEKKNGAVFIANSAKFNKPSEEGLRDISNNIENMQREKSKNAKIYCWDPGHINKRIPAQGSIFVFGDTIIDDGHFQKIVIANKEKEKILKQLDTIFNINGVTLFNDITGFAQANSRTSPVSYPDKFEDASRIKELIANRLFEDALKKAREYADRYPNDYIGFYQMGYSNSELGNYKESIKNYSKVIELKPDYPEAYNNLGTAKYSMPERDFEGAIKDYTKAIELKPGYFKAYHNRGNSKKGKRDFEGAIKDYVEAIRLKPDDADAYNNRGTTYEKIDENEKAESDFRKAKELEENKRMNMDDDDNSAGVPVK